MKVLQLGLLTCLCFVNIFCSKEEDVVTIQDRLPKLRFEVTDAVTGLPVHEAAIELFGAGAGYIEKVDSILIDTTGILDLPLKKYYSTIVYHLRAPGYVPKIQKQEEVKRGEINTFKIQMRPFNAVVRLEVENIRPEPDTFFFNLINGAVILDAGELTFLPFSSPLFFQPYEKFTADIPALADDAVSIFWTWNGLEPGPVPPFKDVVIIPLGDTLIYKVTN